MNTKMNQHECGPESGATGETFCQKVVAQIKQAKKRLIQEFGDRLAGHESMLRLALNEAEALAWETSYPQLVFATLATEKVQAAAAWQTRQRLLAGGR